MTASGSDLAVTLTGANLLRSTRDITVVKKCKNPATPLLTMTVSTCCPTLPL